MKPIFQSKYGSFLYGCNIETSDQDRKGIFLPSAEDILFGNHSGTYSENTNISGLKNTKDDIDTEMFSLKKFLYSITTDQTFSLELLHSPKQFWTMEPDPIWLELVANKDKLISKNITSMVSYAKNQAMRYGQKGRRLEVFKHVVNMCHCYNETISLRDLINNITIDLIEDYPDFISIHKKDGDTSGVEYLDVNGVMVPMGASVKYALEVYKPRLEEYGSRAKKAMEDNGQDLKALYHSIRISRQIVELLTTGTITFPRPEAPLLLDVRNGKFSDMEIKQLIDDSFEEVRKVEKTSTLRESADKKWANEFLMDAHLNVIMNEKKLIKGWEKVPTYWDYIDEDFIK